MNLFEKKYPFLELTKLKKLNLLLKNVLDAIIELKVCLMKKRINWLKKSLDTDKWIQTIHLIENLSHTVEIVEVFYDMVLMRKPQKILMI